MDDRLNERMDKLVLSYIDYVQESLNKARNGSAIDEKAIYVLGDAIRVLHHAKKMLEKSIEPQQ